MNKRQRVFLRESGRTAAILADFFESECAGCPEDSEPYAARAVWKSMSCFGKYVSEELEGFLKGLAVEDTFEIADWFEYIRRTYGSHGEVLTLCQILCCAFYGGDLREIAAVLRLYSRGISIAELSGTRPDMTQVWLRMAEKKEKLFVDADKAVLRRRLIGLLCCCAGIDKKYAEYQRMFFGFIRAELSEPDEKEKALGELRLRAAAKGYISFYTGIEAAFV